ncbi:DUF4145 domain-containing protein [Marinagarivorans algicola]|uniref:DUF4145 domain-containing protein n=1 Tax=Marinagarivorans algicola TaxID=1513270 RepID=UPI0006B4EBD3|nr:DUF4145 domain-containing protein [Marinagarivorans algicola]
MRLLEEYEKSQKSIDKYRVDSSFSYTGGDLFTCPSCKNIHLKVDWETLFLWEKPDSEKSKYEYLEEQQSWNREWSEYEFSGRLKCECGEMVTVAGVAVEEPEYPPSEDIDTPYYEYKYKINYFSKTLQSFWAPNDTPTDCVKLLNDTFSLFHINLDAAGNRLRVLLELIINEQLNEDEGTSQLNLYRKIEKLSNVLPDTKYLANLCRIIGNDASHSHKINEKELTQAFCYMSHLLERVYAEEHAILRISKNHKKRQ